MGWGRAALVPGSSLETLPLQTHLREEGSSEVTGVPSFDPARAPHSASVLPFFIFTKGPGEGHGVGQGVLLDTVMGRAQATSAGTSGQGCRR